MFIIAGAGHPKTEKHITVKPVHCYHCNNDVFWILEKTKYHITLFFIPVVPYKTEYLYSCSICGSSSKLSKEEFERRVQFETRPYK